MFQSDEEPKIRLGDVDVMELDIDNKVMGLTVHTTCWEHELATPKIKEKVQGSVKRALNYLVEEGFLSQVKGWNVSVAVMGHPPKE
jgi:hypothetical protein